jgi:hypothetical protein
MNSPAMLEFMREVTGLADIAGAECAGYPLPPGRFSDAA